MKLIKMHWVGIIAAVVMALLDVLFFLNNRRVLVFLLGIAVGVGVLRFVVVLVLENKKEEKIGEMFLDFTRNLAESVATGTPISKGIIIMRKNNYGVLNPYIAKLANQIELGIPVSKAMETFSSDVGSPVVSRAIELIKEAEKAGGEIDYILDSTAKSISEVEKLKQERKAAIYNLVVQGYLIFFIFIGIILVMEFKIIPLTAGVSGFSDIGSARSFAENTNQERKLTPEELTKPFLYLLLTQGLFVGLVIGKLTEGSIKKGIKHSFILMITAFLVSSGVRLFVAPSGM